MAGNIVVRGARTHNLKNIDIAIPRERLVVITGVSGSGKSSLAFDTLYAEGQRRYLESLGAEARLLLRQLERPDVDRIEGLSPTIAVEQKAALASPRSTVGTLTDTHDYLRLLFARVGEPHCPRCGRAVVAQPIAAIVDELLALPPETRITVLAPVMLESAGAEESLREFVRHGFTRFLVDGEMHEIEALPGAGLGAACELDLMIDRLAIRAANHKRLADSLEVAARQADGRIKVRILNGAEQGGAREMLFSLQLRCAYCGIAIPEITPGMFSFNTPEGACPTCNGLGSVRQVRRRSRRGSDADAAVPCAECGGTRLRAESRIVRIGAFDIAQVADWTVTRVRDFFSLHPFDERRRAIGQKITDEIVKRCTILVELGLGYLSLGRSAATLSAGELQRVRLATELGSAMAGVLYVLDEPSIGLHQKDNAKLLALLKQLRDAGNTVLVVEHDREAMLEADYLIDMGPAAGVNGGRVIDQGTPAELISRPQSLTGRYLAGLVTIAVPHERRCGSGQFLKIRNARKRNLKTVTVDIPVGAMTCVTGVSGAGKSTLIMDVLYPALTARLQRRKAEIAADRTEIFGWENFLRVVGVDQSPIGRTARSNPATYTGVFDHLRELFSQLPEARLRGYDSGRFSFNASGGRCEACAGEGAIRVEMHLLPEAYITCAVCKGERFNRETLEIEYKGLSIAAVLRLSIDQALELLGNIPAIAARLRTLHEVGLGYLALGQPASTLAGGEAQRVKLARELARQSGGRTLYVLDEPTAGLHFEDVKTLLALLNRLVDRGNTIIIVEHNLDVIKSADHVIDLGPEGGERGGELIAVGTPEVIAGVPASVTGYYLRPILETVPQRPVKAE